MLRPAWLPVWESVVAGATADPTFVAWLLSGAHATPADIERRLSPPERGGELAYRYDGGIATWKQARRRGWAACAEVAAYAAAAARLLWPDATIRLLLEGEPSSDAGYSHLRIAVGSDVVDPYDRESRVGQAETVDYVARLGEGFVVSGAHL